MKKCYPQLALTVLCVMFFSFPSFGTHMRGGQVLVKRIDNGSRKYEIRIQAYIDSHSPVPFGGASTDILSIYARNGTAVQIMVPEITQTSVDGTRKYEIIDDKRHVAFVEFVYTHVFPSDDTYTISFMEVNRNAGVLNFSRSVDTPFFISTTLMVSGIANGEETPINLERPNFYGIVGQPFTCSLGAYSTTAGAELTYRLVAPKSSQLSAVANYSTPENMTINYLTGLITWDGMFNGMEKPGEYGFAVEIMTYKDGIAVNRTVRDFQILMEASPFFNRNITVLTSTDFGQYQHLYIPEKKKIKVFFEYDHDSGYTADVKVSSEAVEWISFETYDSAQEDKKIKVGVVTVDPNNLVDRTTPYLFNLRGTLSKNGIVNEQDFSFLLLTQDVDPWGPISPNTTTEQNEIVMQAYPNPVHDYLNFNDQYLNSSEVIIVSSDGKRQSLPIEENHQRIDFRLAPSGIYLIKITNGKKTQTIKIKKD